MIGEIANHLWQSTVFALAAGLLAIAFRRNQARVRYWLWFSASMKFFIPFALLITLGGRLEWAPTAQPIAPTLSSAVVQISQPFVDQSPTTESLAPSTPGGPAWFAIALLIFWMSGMAAIALIRLRLWRRVRAVVCASTPRDIPGIPSGVDVRSAPRLMEPGVVGVWRPVLLVAEGIEDHLTPRQLDAVLAHELCHIRRRDNLTATIHMVVEAVFWFHPLVWWIGARLVEERERACDEEVLRLGGDPRVYAEGILNVCKRYAAAPLVCASGVSGANLRKRIEAIMMNRMGRKLNIGTKVALAATAATVLALPVVVGAMSPPADRAGQSSARPQFEVASIRRNIQSFGMIGGDCRGTDNAANGAGAIAGLAKAAGLTPTSPGRCRFLRSTLKELIAYAHDIRLSDAARTITGGPGWIDSDRFDVEAKSERVVPVAQMKLMLRSMLEDRFMLRIRFDTRETQGFALAVASGGSKLQESIDAQTPDRISGGLGGKLTASNTSMSTLARVLALRLGRPVEDRTRLTGRYDFTLSWTPGDGEAMPFGGRLPPEIKEKLQANADQSGTSLFTALQEQLGLRLIAERVPGEVLVVENAERPSEN